jgi:hypothetical protein
VDRRSDWGTLNLPSAAMMVGEKSDPLGIVNQKQLSVCLAGSPVKGLSGADIHQHKDVCLGVEQGLLDDAAVQLALAG